MNKIRRIIMNKLSKYCYHEMTKNNAQYPEENSYVLCCIVDDISKYVSYKVLIWCKDEDEMSDDGKCHWFESSTGKQYFDECNECSDDILDEHIVAWKYFQKYEVEKKA